MQVDMCIQRDVCDSYMAGHTEMCLYSTHRNINSTPIR